MRAGRRGAAALGEETDDFPGAEVWRLQPLGGGLLPTEARGSMGGAHFRTIANKTIFQSGWVTGGTIL